MIEVDHVPDSSSLSVTADSGRTWHRASFAGSSASGHTLFCRTSQLEIAMTHTGAVAGEVGGYIRFTNGGPAGRSGWS